MKIEETYILNYREYSNIGWLVKEIHQEGKIPLTINSWPVIHLIKVYRSVTDKWYLELPAFEYGRTTYVPNHIREIETELTPEMIDQLN